MQDSTRTVLRTLNHTSAMFAYWDKEQRCVFSNDAYVTWFGRTPEEMMGMTMETLLGPQLYAKNLPHILGALAGKKQVFERRIPVPNGEVWHAIATYTPDIVEGQVMGFSVHVADVTALRRREAELEAVIKEVSAILERTKRSFQSKDLGALRLRLEELSRERDRKHLDV